MDTVGRFTLGQGAIAFLFFLGFLLGGAGAAVVLVGSQIPLKCFDAGNAADWIAAVGTWVIGAGAMKIAYDANAKRKRDAEIEERRRLDAKKASLLLLITEARVAQVLDAALDKEFGKGEEMDLSSIRLLIQIAARKLGTIRWDGSQKTGLGLDENALEALVHSEHEILAVIDYCERFLVKYPADDSDFDWENCKIVAWLRMSAADLATDAARLEAAIGEMLDADQEAFADHG